MFLEFSEDLPDNFHVTLAGIFSVNQDVIEVHDDENIKFYCLNFIDISLEAGGGVGKIKRHDLILEMVILHSEGCFPLVTLLNSHSMICVCQIQLSKTLGAT